jgi:hypothetical protein
MHAGFQTCDEHETKEPLVTRSVTSAGSRLARNLDPVPVTGRERCLRCKHYSKAVTPLVVFRTGSYSKRLCPTCAKGELERYGGEWWILMGPCAVCGINVFASKPCWLQTVPCPNGWLVDRYGGKIICSMACTKKLRLMLRRDERAAARVGKVCGVCGGAIEASRVDTTTCSSKCRQAAYRRRKRSVTADG